MELLNPLKSVDFDVGVDPVFGFDNCSGDHPNSCLYYSIVKVLEALGNDISPLLHKRIQMTITSNGTFYSSVNGVGRVNELRGSRTNWAWDPRLRRWCL